MFFRSLIFFCSIAVLFLNDSNAEEYSEFHNAFKEGLNHINYYETPQGNTLRYTLFESPKRGKKQTVVFVQGRGTFLEFYEELITPLLERGFDVWSYDLTGQGGSSRLLHQDNHSDLDARHLQHIDSFDIYLNDLDALLNNIVLPQCQGRLILGGYSTGGHIALRYLQNYSESPFESAFVISPLLYLKTPLPNFALSYLLWGASWILDMERYIPGSGYEDPIFHMDPSQNPYTADSVAFSDMVLLCCQYPSLMMGGASVGWLNAALNSVHELWRDIDNIRIPVLIATGGDDTVVDVSFNEDFADSLKKGTHVYYPEGRHELFREVKIIRSHFWSAFDDFLDDDFIRIDTP